MLNARNLPPLKSERMTCPLRSRKPWLTWRLLASVGTMLLLSGFLPGCASGPGVARPSVSRGPNGNAVLAALPKGSRLLVANEAMPFLQGAFINEIETGNPMAESTGCKPVPLILKQDLVIATPAYLLDRDAREVELLRRIEILKQENDRLRLNK